MQFCTHCLTVLQTHAPHTHRPESSSGATSHSRGSHGVSMTPADAFVHACGCGQAAVVRRLLAAGTSSTAVHVDVVDAEGWTGLLRSIQAGYTQVSLLLLLEFGAHPEIRTPSGCSALLWAARWGRIDVVKALLSRGANSYARDEMVLHLSPTFAACTSHTVCHHTLQGSTALHHAASNGHMEVAEYLVAQGFRPSTCNHVCKAARHHTQRVQLIKWWCHLLHGVLTGRENCIRHCLRLGHDQCGLHAARYGHNWMRRNAVWLHFSNVPALLNHPTPHVMQMPWTASSLQLVTH